MPPYLSIPFKEILEKILKNLNILSESFFRDILQHNIEIN